MKLAFIGGGNMAGAILGGLQRRASAAAVTLIEPSPERRAELERQFGVRALAAADASLAGHDLIVLAVKPQQMRAACEAVAPYVGQAVVLSIAAGTGACDIAQWTGSARIVRAMPNTPALIGQGISGLAALPAVDAAGRAQAEAVLSACGQVLWFDDEAALDAVTALSGSGPAYVFLFIESLIAGGRAVGLEAAAARALALATLQGAAALAAQSDEPPAVLRERVTSKGGTTAAALASLQADGFEAGVVRAVEAAWRRARELKAGG